MELFLPILLLFGQDRTSEVEKAVEMTEKAKSFHYQVLIRKKGGELLLEGALSGEVFWLKSEKGEIVRDETRVLARADGGEWVKPKGQALRNLEKFQDPRKFVARLAGNSSGMKKEKSGRIGSVTVDIYVALAGKENVQDAFESSGMPLRGSRIDWTKTKQGVLFYVGRSTRHILRVEIRKGSEAPSVVVEFGDFNRARIPREVTEAIASDP